MDRAHGDILGRINATARGISYHATQDGTQFSTMHWPLHCTWSTVTDYMNQNGSIMPHTIYYSNDCVQVLHRTNMRTCVSYSLVYMHLSLAPAGSIPRQRCTAWEVTPRVWEPPNSPGLVCAHSFAPHHHHDMAGTSTPLHAGLVSHQSLRPNYYHTASAARVSSVATPNSDEKPSKHDKHKSHRHHHSSSRRDNEHRHSSSRRHAKEVVQSAIQLQPPTSFGDLLKQARGSKDTSPSHSRKGSIAPGGDGNVEGKETRHVGIAITPRRPLRPEDVELERKRVEARER
jgi:hypothetical protein